MKIKLALFMTFMAWNLSGFADDAIYFYLECESGQCIERNHEGKKVELEAKPVLSIHAGDISKAFYGPTIKGDHELTIDVNEKKAAELESVTKGNLGKKMAFVVEDQILTLPIIEGAISQGKFAVTGRKSDSFKPLEIAWLQKIIERSVDEQQKETKQRQILTWSLVALLIVGSLAFAFLRR